MKAIDTEKLAERATALRDEVQIRARDAWEDSRTRRRIIIVGAGALVVLIAGLFWLSWLVTSKGDDGPAVPRETRSAANQAERLQRRVTRDPRFEGVVAVAAPGPDGGERVVVAGSVRTQADLAALRELVASNPPQTPLSWSVAVLLRPESPAEDQGGQQEEPEGPGGG